jgi:hypothetical protein
MSCVRIILSISYSLVIAGTMGLILFACRFPLSGRLKDLEHAPQRLFGLLNGYQVWKWSLLLILMGTAGQLIACWLT